MLLNIALNRFLIIKAWLFSVHASSQQKLSTIQEENVNSGEMSMDQPSIDQPEKEKDELVNKSWRIAILQEDKAREARRWQRKRETIKRFAGMR